MTPEDSLVGFTPEEIAEAEYALDNDPIELARNELARRIPLDRCDDMTMENAASPTPNNRTVRRRSLL